MVSNENPKNTTKIVAFEEIKGVDELVPFLMNRATNKKYIYHYTNLEALQGILNNQFLVLGNVMDLNDRYEYKLARPTLKERTYLSCFSRDDNENIAMWAMYASPWNKGIRIGFNSKKLKKLIQNTSYVYQVDEHFNLIESNPIIPIEKTLTCVAYYKESQNRLDWSNKRLYLGSLQGFENLTSNPNLHGYIKHKAWSYESEVRMMIRLKDYQVYKRIGVKLTQDLIDDMEIMTGPSVTSIMKKRHWDLLEKSAPSEFEGLIKIKEIFLGKDV